MFNIFDVLLAIPNLFTAIDKSVRAVEIQFGSGTGEQKKQAVIDALNADYDVIDGVGHFPDEIDKLIKESLIPDLIDIIAAQFNVV